LLARSVLDRAAAWLLSQTGQETSFVFRLRMRLLNVHLDDVEFDGWPWFPGAAAWVTPTALSILAMKKYSSAGSSPHNDRIHNRIDEGRRFLLSRRCRDGGWNHGSSKALGYDSGSYPETTGAALLALHDSSASELASAEALAERQLPACRSMEAASWLTLGLASRGRKVDRVPRPPRNTTMELALSTLAQAAAEGRNVFLA
jgi:hypothetical protein